MTSVISEERRDIEKTLEQEAGHPPRAELPRLLGRGQTLYTAGLSSNVTTENVQNNLQTKCLLIKSMSFSLARHETISLNSSSWM